MEDFFDFIGPDITEVETYDVRAFVASEIKRGAARSSVGRRLATVRSFFKYLHREGIVKKNPAKTVPTPKLPQNLPSYLTVDEVFSLMEVKDKGKVNEEGENTSPTSARDLAILELAYSSGLRAGELEGLNVEDVNLERKTVRVMGKGKKVRMTPMGGKAAKALTAYMSERAGKDEAAGKATYPAIYGLEASRREAKRLTKRASQALGVFARKGEVLRGIADYLLDRDY